jgi:quinol monooxygenase YgiN
MLVAIGDVVAQVPERRAAERVMLSAQAAARQQDGCVSFVFAEVLGDPGRFIVVQRWRDHGALEAHYRSDSFAAYQAAIGPLLARESELEVHEVTHAARPVASVELDLGHDD